MSDERHASSQVSERESMMSPDRPAAFQPLSPYHAILLVHTSIAEPFFAINPVKGISNTPLQDKSSVGRVVPDLRSGATPVRAARQGRVLSAVFVVASQLEGLLELVSKSVADDCLLVSALPA